MGDYFFADTTALSHLGAVCTQTLSSQVLLQFPHTLR